MRAVIQRVAAASVETEGEVIGRIGRGLLILLGVHAADGEKDIAYLADKICNLRIFEDEAGKMNLSLLDIVGSALVVSSLHCMQIPAGRRPALPGLRPGDGRVPLFTVL